MREALAEACVETGRHDEAIAELKPLVRAQPRFSIRIAAILAQSGRPEQALETLDALPELDAAGRLAAALVYLDALRPEKAAALLQPAAARARANTDYQATLGLAQLGSGQYRAAVRTLQPLAEAAAGHSRSDPALHYYLGSALRLSGDLERLPGAEAQLGRAVELSPDDPLYHYERGLALVQLREWDRAQVELEEAARLGPDLVEAQRDLARLHQRQGRPLEAALARTRYLRLVDDAPGAVRLLSPLFAQHPENRELGISLSEAQFGAGKLREAVATLAALRRRLPDDPEVVWGQFRLHRSLEQYKEATAAAEELARLTPQDTTLLQERADLRERLSDFPAAEADLLALAAKDPRDPYPLYRLGYRQTLWFPQPEKRKQAEDSLRKALALKPDLAEAHYALAMLLQKERPAEAVTHARRALDLRPGNAEALRVLARAYQLAGDARRAGETFKLLRVAQARAAAREAAELPVRQLRDLRRSRLALARLHLRHGDLASATRELEMLTHSFPQEPEARRLLHRLYAHQRRFQRQFEVRPG